MANVEILKRGDVQFTTAGTGISHSEFNANKTLPVHFLQIWVKPDQARLPPAYHTKNFSDDAKTNKLVHIISPVDESKADDSTIGIHTDLHMFASLLKPGNSVTHVVEGNVDNRRVYVHLTGTGGSLKVNGSEVLKEGD